MPVLYMYGAVYNRYMCGAVCNRYISWCRVLHMFGYARGVLQGKNMFADRTAMPAT